jgi:hypothetical protein
LLKFLFSAPEITVFSCCTPCKLETCLCFGQESKVDETGEICALLECNAVSSGNPLPTFRDNVLVPFSRLKKSKNITYSFWTSWALKMEPIRCPETSVKDYHSTLRYTPEDCRSHQHRGGSLESSMRLKIIICSGINMCKKGPHLHSHDKLWSTRLQISGTSDGHESGGNLNLMLIMDNAVQYLARKSKQYLNFKGLTVKDEWYWDVMVYRLVNISVKFRREVIYPSSGWRSTSLKCLAWIFINNAVRT